MPELPEVENIRQGLERLGSIGQRFAKVELLREDLRVPFPPQVDRNLAGESILAIRRRAKYLLFETENYIVINHLGMTGSWRVGPTLARKHDHVIFHFKSGLSLIFNDPRRFGLLDLAKRSQAAKNRWLRNLGVEPLGDDFNAEKLFASLRGLKCSIKAYLMDQRRVVGVGNIYASEALFRSGVRPTRQGGRVSRAEIEHLVIGVQMTLRAAIAHGGSTIRDYRNSDGERGSFQDQFLVYGRDGKACLKCATPIRIKMVAGRSTFWCPTCQR